jgi:hypothetical protein
MLLYGRDFRLPEENMMSQRSKRELLENLTVTFRFDATIPLK